LKFRVGLPDPLKPRAPRSGLPCRDRRVPTRS
jgi:hypothetical protein